MPDLTRDASPRAQLRLATLSAAYRWRDALVDDLTAVATEIVGPGDGLLVVMRGQLNVPVEHYDDLEDDADVGEELASVNIATYRNRVTLTAAHPSPLWMQLVSLWDELREALTHGLGTFIPVNLVVDLERGMLAAYEDAYCPDMGEPEPDLVVDMHQPVPGTTDPFEDLLNPAPSDEDYFEHITVRLSSFDLPAPGRPAHEPGACSQEE